MSHPDKSDKDGEKEFFIQLVSNKNEHKNKGKFHLSFKISNLVLEIDIISAINKKKPPIGKAEGKKINAK